VLDVQINGEVQTLEAGSDVAMCFRPARTLCRTDSSQSMPEGQSKPTGDPKIVLYVRGIATCLGENGSVFC
jgi:hypothetical protein